MSSVVISGDTSGTVTVAAPAVAGSNTLTLQAATATNAVNTLGTAVASTSGTSIDFTGLPSWIKRITVMFSGVSTNGVAKVQIQIGSGSITASGYLGAETQQVSGAATSGALNSSAFLIDDISNSAGVRYGHSVLTLITANTWVFSSVMGRTDNTGTNVAGGAVALSGTLDRVRITTSNGTDTFDAGTINILYEG